MTGRIANGYVQRSGAPSLSSAFIHSLATVVASLALEVVSLADEGIDARPLTSMAPSPTNRLTVAVLNIANGTGDASMEHWHGALEGMLRRALGEAKAIRLVPGQQYALSQLNLRAGDPLDETQAGRIGQIIESRRVVWGSYNRQGGTWLVNVSVLNVATAKTYVGIGVTGTNWFQIRDELAEKILMQLGVVPTSIERQRMLKRWTSSAETVEWVSKAHALAESHRPENEIEAAARRAIQSDPSSYLARLLLGDSLFSQGKLVEAEKEVRVAVNLEPDFAPAHLLLGGILGGNAKYDPAEQSLKTAARLDPDDSESFERLGELYVIEGMTSKAIEPYETASRLEPFSASIHAHLGHAYAVDGRVSPAITELKEAERLVLPGEVNAEQFLAYAYERLRDAPAAVEHYEKLINVCRAQGLDPQGVQGFERSMADLKARLSPVYVVASQPKDYSTGDLADYFKHHLDPADLVLITNPLECTPEMQRWARGITEPATNSLQKAQFLFEALAHHAHRSPGGTRTARQVFEDWNSTNASFRCSEYTAYYVAVSRACGLTTYCAFVDEDYSGRRVAHECACLFLGTNALLVDPSYFWFGVPHKKFGLLTDVEATAIWLGQQSNSRKQAVGLSLAPHLPVVCFNYVMQLIANDDFASARKILTDTPTLDSDSMLSSIVRGYLAVREGNPELGAVLLKKAVAANPDSGSANMYLGLAYSRQGKLAEAREAYRNALRDESAEYDVEFVHRSVSEINEMLGESGAAGPAPQTAADFIHRGDSYASSTMFHPAITNFSEAIKLDPDNPVAYAHRGSARAYVHEFSQAIEDFTEAIRLSPNDALLRVYRAAAYWEMRRYSDAIADSREATRISPENPDCFSRLGSHLATCPDASLRDPKGAVEAFHKACELSGWTDWKMVTNLAYAEAEAGDDISAAEHEQRAMRIDGIDEKTRREMEAALAAYHARNRLVYPTNVFAGPKIGVKATARTNNVDAAALRRAAEDGDADAQAKLAGFLNAGSNGFPTNRLEAYKWAALADSQGNREGHYVVQELKLFLTADEISQAEKAVREFRETAGRR